MITSGYENQIEFGKIIQLEGKSPYDIIGKYLEEWAKNHYYGEMIVTLWTSMLGETTTLYLMEEYGQWIWETDWYEGGDVKLLGFIPVDWLKVNGHEVRVI